MEYKIRWVSKITGATGEGTATFGRAEAEAIAKLLNKDKESGRFCVHTAVPIKKPLAGDNARGTNKE